VVKEGKAMETIVIIATMKPEVLMADVNSKKKRIIARIDATPEGTKFLITSIKKENDQDAIEVYKRRIQVGKDLTQHRQKLNLEFVAYQKGWDRFPLTREQKSEILSRFIEAKIKLLSSTNQSLLAVTGDKDNIIVFLNTILIDELTETQEKINKNDPIALLLP